MSSTTTDAKRFTQLKAEFAKHGHTLHQATDRMAPTGYMAVHDRWGMARYLPTFADAEQFLIQVGGGRHE